MERRPNATQRSGKTNWLTGFLAILYYEFLWNLRKKKFIGLFLLVVALVTLELALPPILAIARNQAFTQDSTVVFQFYNGLSGIFLFFIAVATTMNTISGEFETGTITPLLTKPVSKNTVFVGKLVASFITFIAMYSVLTVYVIVGGILIDGTQDNLQLAPLGLIGLTLATMVWASIVILLGTLSKSSLIAALGSFGVWIGVTVAGGLIGAFLGQTTILFYAPGSGALGSTGDCTGAIRMGNSLFATGTDNLGYLLMQWALNPNTTLNFCGLRTEANMTQSFLASADTIANVAVRDLGVTAIYLVGLLAVSWYAFRRAQIIESA